MHKEHMQEASCKKLHLIPKIHGTCKRLCIIPDGTCRQEASCPGQEAHAGNRLHTIPDKRHMQDAPYDPGRFCAWRSAQNRPDGPKLRHDQFKHSSLQFITSLDLSLHVRLRKLRSLTVSGHLIT
eukprot:scaffold258700_cov17-Tisochrysis_lutea.AAC.1